MESDVDRSEHINERLEALDNLRLALDAIMEVLSERPDPVLAKHYVYEKSKFARTCAKRGAKLRSRLKKTGKEDKCPGPRDGVVKMEHRVEAEMAEKLPEEHAVAQVRDALWPWRRTSEPRNAYWPWLQPPEKAVPLAEWLQNAQVTLE